MELLRVNARLHWEWNSFHAIQRSHEINQRQAELGRRTTKTPLQETTLRSCWDQRITNSGNKKLQVACRRRWVHWTADNKSAISSLVAYTLLLNLPIIFAPTAAKWDLRLVDYKSGSRITAQLSSKGVLCLLLHKKCWLLACSSLCYLWSVRIPAIVWKNLKPHRLNPLPRIIPAVIFRHHQSNLILRSEKVVLQQLKSW